MGDNSSLNSTIIAAWYGAIIATIVLIWDVIKWKTSGPRIFLEVFPNIIIIGDQTREGKTFIRVKATNKGNRPTTIESLCMSYYSGRIMKFRNKPAKSFFIKEPSRAQSLPYVLQPGVVWDGMITQDKEVSNMARQGYLMCALYLSHLKKPLKRQILLKTLDATEELTGKSPP